MRDNANFVTSPDNVDNVVNSPDGKIHTEAAHSQLEKVSPLFLWSDEILDFVNTCFVHESWYVEIVILFEILI